MTSQTEARVRVTVQDTTKVVYHRDGMTVAEALKAAGVEGTNDLTVSVNGAPTDDLSAPVQPDDLVVATPRVSNG